MTVGKDTKSPTVHPGDSVVVRHAAGYDASQLGGGTALTVAEVTGNGTLLTNSSMAVKPGTNVDIYCPGYKPPVIMDC